MTHEKLTASVLQWVKKIAEHLRQDAVPPPSYYTSFTSDPNSCYHLVEIIDKLPEVMNEEQDIFFSACIFALDIFLSQLQIAVESGDHKSSKILDKLMSQLAITIASNNHSLAFWMPVLSTFYELHIELSPALKNSYMLLADYEDSAPYEEETSAGAIENILDELAHLSKFDTAEYLFAQSYAMPAEFFVDLVIDLYNSNKGADIAILSLLHPDPKVRELVYLEHDNILANTVLSSIALSRLQAIQKWYPKSTWPQFNKWIKHQRKKGVIFATAKDIPQLTIKASEVDGGGAQGIFIHIKNGRQHRIANLLIKQGIGLKDSWITPIINQSNVREYFSEAFGDNVTIRQVDLAYLKVIVNHFIKLTIDSNNIPSIHMLEIQEELGIQFQPQKIEALQLIKQLAIDITPFTPEALQESLKRSGKWCKSKKMTESWYLENSAIDKLVNHHSTIINGIKQCNFTTSMADVFAQEIEPDRPWWAFHFLWLALWSKSCNKKNEKLWLDCFFIAYSIYNETPLKEIPIMYDICKQTVINSIETMLDRRTHLNQE